LFDDLPQLEDGDEPVTIFVKDVRVKIWVEKKLRFALTEELQLESLIQP
jgi:hypothetical protein